MTEMSEHAGTIEEALRADPEFHGFAMGIRVLAHMRTSPTTVDYEEVLRRIIDGDLILINRHHDFDPDPVRAARGAQLDREVARRILESQARVDALG